MRNMQESEDEEEKCVIYLRVSSKKQDEENQFSSCKRYAEARGFEIDEIYREKRSAYKEENQIKKAKIMERARKGEFSHVIVWALDRWTREGSKRLLEDIDRLSKYGVELHSLQESFLDQINIQGELGEIIRNFISSLLAWEAKMESKRKGERVREAYERKSQAADGEFSWGRRKTSFDIDRALELRADGLGYRKIADELEADVSYGTVRNRLKEMKTCND